MKKSELRRQLKMAQINAATAWRTAKDITAAADRRTSEANTRVASMEAATTRMTLAMADMARAKSRAETAAAAAEAECASLRTKWTQTIILTEIDPDLRAMILGELDQYAVEPTTGKPLRPECERLAAAAPTRPWWVKPDGSVRPLTESNPEA